MIFIITGLAFFAEGMIAAMLVPYIESILKGDAQVMGWCATSQSLGALLGGVIVGRYAKRFRPQPLLGLCLFSIGLTYIIIAVFPSLPLVLTLLLFFGIPTITALVTLQSLLQQNVEDSYLGRVFGSLGSLMSMSLLVGAGIGAITGNFTGPILVFEIVGGLHFITAVIIFIFGGIF